MVDTNRFSASIAEKISEVAESLPKDITFDLPAKLAELGYDESLVIDRVKFYYNVKEGTGIDPRDTRISWTAGVQNYKVSLYPRFRDYNFLFLREPISCPKPNKDLASLQSNLLKSFGIVAKEVVFTEPIIQLPSPTWITVVEFDGIHPEYYLKSEAILMFNKYCEEVKKELGCS